MADPKKQRPKRNQSTKVFAKDYWASLMDRERQYFERDLLAKKRNKKKEGRNDVDLLKPKGK